MHEPSALIIVGTNQAVLSTGLNQATRAFHQVPLGRACFDDTKVALTACVGSGRISIYIHSFIHYILTVLQLLVNAEIFFSFCPNRASSGYAPSAGKVAGFTASFTCAPQEEWLGTFGTCYSISVAACIMIRHFTPC